MHPFNSNNIDEKNYPFEELLSSTSVIFYQCSLEEDYPIVFITKNVKEKLGFSREAIYQDFTFWIDRIHPEEREFVKKGFYNILKQKNRVFEYRIKTESGKYCWIRDENTVIHDEDGNPESIAGNVIDITNQKEAQDKLREFNETLEQRIEERTKDLRRANEKLKQEVEQRNEAEKTLEDSEQRYRAYTELSFDAIFEIDLDGTITDCNPRACQMFGYSKEELIGMDTLELTPDRYKDSQPAMLSEKITTGNEAWERVYKKKDGTLLPTEINTKMYTRGNKKSLIAYVRDISEQKKYEQTIRESLKEKETLLAEVHHRVKNNLAIISGLLELQSLNSENPKLTGELRVSQSRIQSIAMVHEKLYQSESFSDILLSQYVDELLDFISETHEQDGQSIEVHKDIDPVTLPMIQAIPCGLILNELITNAYKHAFMDRDEGNIYLTLSAGPNDFVTLEVEDDGVGLPDDFNIYSSTSMGMTLISTLVKQINGSLDLSTGKGACFEITFEMGKQS